MADIDPAKISKLETEVAKLREQLETLQQAIPTKDACRQLIDYVEQTPEPFCTGQKENPWINYKPNGKCICSIQ